MFEKAGSSATDQQRLPDEETGPPSPGTPGRVLPLLVGRLIVASLFLAYFVGFPVTLLVNVYDDLLQDIRAVRQHMRQGGVNGQLVITGCARRPHAEGADPWVCEGTFHPDASASEADAAALAGRRFEHYAGQQPLSPGTHVPGWISGADADRLYGPGGSTAWSGLVLALTMTAGGVLCLGMGLSVLLGLLVEQVSPRRPPVVGASSTGSAIPSGSTR